MARGGQQQGGQQAAPTDWVTRAADDAVRHAGGEEAVAAGATVTVASGISPSGPIHLGNLREFLTVHFVAEELRRRGVTTRHLHSWDDFDRFRKVPVGVDESWNEHIGRPLSAVPDPWECHDSWATHFKAPLQAALAEMGCEMDELSQTELYRSGTYREQILTAVRRRDDIERVLARYRTKVAPEPESEEEAADLADSVATDEDDDPDAAAGLERFPFKPYCRTCGRDTTHLTAYDDESTDLSYTCQSCGDSHVTNLATQDEGKLVWKVDWPMRWAFEGVNFEPGGVDHATPGSSYTVGKELVKQIFGGRAPSFVGYSFVGVAGMAKMSSSKGGVPTATDALKVLEPAILRWLYVRRQPKQAFNVEFGPEVVRLYDEWDALGRKAADPSRRDAQVLAWERAVETTSAGRLPVTRGGRAVPGAVLGRRRDRRVGRADQPDRLPRGPRARLGGRPRAAAVPGDGVDGRVRARPPSGPSSGPAPTPRGSRRCPSARPAGSRCSSTGSPSSAPESSGSSRSPRWRTACPSSRTACPSTPTPPTRSRRTRRSSSRSSTTCSSTRTAAPACPPWSSPSAPTGCARC